MAFPRKQICPEKKFEKVSTFKIGKLSFYSLFELKIIDWSFWHNLIGATTISITTLNIMTFSIMTLSLSDTEQKQHSA